MIKFFKALTDTLGSANRTFGQKLTSCAFCHIGYEWSGTIVREQNSENCLYLIFVV